LRGKAEKSCKSARDFFGPTTQDQRLAMLKLARGLNGLTLSHCWSFPEIRREVLASSAADTAWLHDDCIGDMVVQKPDAEKLTRPKPLDAARRSIADKSFEFNGAALDAEHAAFRVTSPEHHAMRLGDHLTVAFDSRECRRAMA
jgi:hypothetical protein